VICLGCMQIVLLPWPVGTCIIQGILELVVI
jgi:hypothetical protein